MKEFILDIFLLQAHAKRIIVHYIFDNVVLADGKNILTAVVVTSDGKEYRDEIEWYYTGEKRCAVDNFENKGEHSGF